MLAINCVHLKETTSNKNTIPLAPCIILLTIYTICIHI